MARECEFYYYDSYYNEYSCIYKKEQDLDSKVDSDWVHKYCYEYNHENCPYFIKAKGGSTSSGGCYLTSACVDAMGLDDDCDALTVLRHFRDTYLAKTESGKKDILQYYHTAPLIVERINTGDDCPLSVYKKIYNDLVLPCISFIKENQLERAYHHYKAYTLMLEKKYLLDSN